MKVICSYCRKEMGSVNPIESDELSHGICEDCYQYFMDQWQGQNLDEYLERFNAPVVAFDEDVRAIAANKLALKALGKKPETVIGFLGGEIIECVYARRPEGCGHTKHCLACSIRLTVTETMKTGKAIIRKPAYFERADRKVDLCISTYKEENYVRLVIERDENTGNH